MPGVYGGISSTTDYSPPTTHYPLSFHILAHSFALFCTRAKLNSFIFKRFRTLCTKHPGWGWGEPLAARLRRGGTLLVKLYAPQEEKGRIEVRTFTKAWQEKERGRPEGRRRSNHGLKSDKPTAGLGRVSNSGRGCTRSWTRQACRCWGRDFSRRRGPAD